MHAVGQQVGQGVSGDLAQRHIGAGGVGVTVYRQPQVGHAVHAVHPKHTLHDLGVTQCTTKRPAGARVATQQRVKVAAQRQLNVLLFLVKDCSNYGCWPALSLLIDTDNRHQNVLFLDVAQWEAQPIYLLFYLQSRIMSRFQPTGKKFDNYEQDLFIFYITQIVKPTTNYHY